MDTRLGGEINTVVFLNTLIMELSITLLTMSTILEEMKYMDAMMMEKDLHIMIELS